MDLNKVMLIGRLTADPEMRTTPSGQSVCTLRIATNRVWTDKQGQKQRNAEYHSVVLWARLAEIASQYLKRGDMAFIEGRIQTRSWQDQTGQKKYRTEVVAERLQLGPKGLGGGGMASETKEPIIEESSATKPAEDQEIPIIEEEGEIDVKDIPF